MMLLEKHLEIGCLDAKCHLLPRAMFLICANSNRTHIILHMHIKNLSTAIQYCLCQMLFLSQVETCWSFYHYHRILSQSSLSRIPSWSCRDQSILPFQLWLPPMHPSRCCLPIRPHPLKDVHAKEYTSTNVTAVQFTSCLGMFPNRWQQPQHSK